RKLEQNRRARGEVRRDRRVRFGPRPNPDLRENNRIPSTSHQLLRTECRPAHFATIPPLAPWYLRLQRVCRRDVATLPPTTAQRRCCPYPTPANGLHLYNLRCCMRPIRDTPHLRCG